MSFVAVAAGTAALGGAVFSGISGKKAAREQSDAAKYAAAVQQQMFNQMREDQRPWREAGVRALPQLEDEDFKRDFTFRDFQADPGYAFRMAEGQKALERSAAARGGLQGGGTMKAIARYGQDFASNEYNNAYNRFNADRDRRFGRLSAIAGIGQTASNQVAGEGTKYANSMGNAYMSAGNASAAGRLHQANAMSGAMSNLGQAGMWMAMNRQAQQPVAHTPTTPTMSGMPGIDPNRVYG